jgi:nucleoside-diphosphate-sugar epimerase
MNAGQARTALITGATSFVGRHLVRALLDRAWQVHALARHKAAPRWSLTAPGLTWHVYDGNTDSVFAAFSAARPDVVFHLASLFLVEHQVADVVPLIQSNLLFGTQVAEAMARNECRKMVNAGTGWQHYQDQPFNPVNLYAATKQAFQDILEYYVQAQELRVITLKLFDTFGPEDDRPKVLSLLCKSAGQSQELLLSPGEQRLNMVYIDDATAAFIQAAERLQAGKVSGHECYAVPAAAPVSLSELAGLVEEILGRPIPARWGARPYRARDVMTPWPGPTLPGWSCRVSLKDGLRRTLAAQSETPA